MKCTPIEVPVELPDGSTAVARGFVCGPRPRARKCCGCGGRATLSCDWKLRGQKAGKTCDRAICAACTEHPGGDPEKDLCPAHAESWAKHPKNPENAGKGPRASTCASCSARIIWCRSASSGKHMPVDIEPTAEGTIVLDATPMQPIATVLSGAELATARAARPENPRLRTSHFATCPDAARHRRKPKTPKETQTP